MKIFDKLLLSLSSMTILPIRSNIHFIHPLIKDVVSYTKRENCNFEPSRSQPKHAWQAEDGPNVDFHGQSWMSTHKKTTLCWIVNAKRGVHWWQVSLPDEMFCGHGISSEFRCLTDYFSNWSKRLYSKIAKVVWEIDSPKKSLWTRMLMMMTMWEMINYFVQSHFTKNIKLNCIWLLLPVLMCERWHACPRIQQ